MSPVSWLLIAVVFWVGGYVDNRFFGQGRIIEVPAWIRLLCGFPRGRNAPTSLLAEAMYFQIAGMLFAVIAIAKGRVAIDDLVAFCIAGLLAFAIVLALFVKGQQ